MPQSLFGYCREGRDYALRIDLQHFIVPVIDDIKISLGTEGNAVRHLKSSLFANNETVPSIAIFAIELPRQFAT